MVGFAFFMFEGIGCLLPIMRETEKPEQSPCIVVSAIVSLCFIYMLFSSICYYAWGADLTEPVVTEMLPADNAFVQVMKLLFCINLIFSYPLTIVPTFNTIEALLLGKRETGSMEEEIEVVNNTLAAQYDHSQRLDEDENEDRLDNTENMQAAAQTESSADYWKVNVLRSLVVLLSVIVVIFVADKLDKVISIAGAIFGMTNVLLLPSLCHLKLTAETKTQKLLDIFIIVFACFMLVFGPVTIALQWKNE